MKNYYELLEVEQFADEALIRQRVDELERKWFYRRQNAPSPERRFEAEQIARDLEAAREVLLDPRRRLDHDRALFQLGTQSQHLLAPTDNGHHALDLPPPQTNTRSPNHLPVPMPPPQVVYPPQNYPAPSSPSGWVYQGGPVLQLSSVGRRLGANILDGLLFVLTLGIGWVVWLFVVMGRGQTPGKSSLGMVTVMAESGNPATFGTMFVREILAKGALFGTLSLVFGGFVLPLYLWLLWDKQNQMLWDKMVSTVVVDAQHP